MFTILTFILNSLENRYKHEAMVDGEPILFEILDTCPKVPLISNHFFIPKFQEGKK